MWKKLLAPLVITFVLTAAVVFIGKLYEFMLILLAFASIFTIVVNFEIAYKIARKKAVQLGAYVAHIGVALFLLGVVATGGFSEKTSIDLPRGEQANVFGYDVTFVGYRPIDNGKKYAFDVKVKKGKTEKTISPVMFVSSMNNSLMREPDIWTTFTKDFYVTPVAYSDGSESSKSEGTNVTLKKGNSTEFNGKKITFVAFDFPKDAMSAMMGGGNFEIGAKLSVEANGKITNIEPKMVSENGKRNFLAVTLEDLNLSVSMTNLDASGAVNLVLQNLSDNNKTAEVKKEVLSIEASVKPFINLVWLGVILMVIGFIISTVKRTKDV